MDLVKKFLGGTIKCRTPVKDKVINGQPVSWDQALVIEVGKTKVQVGKDFLKKLNEFASEPGFQEFIQTLQE